MSLRKPFFAMMLALFLTSSILAGCSSGVASPGKTTLQVWFPGNTGPESELVTKTLVPAFEKANPDIDIAIQYIDWGNLSPKLNSGFAGGIAPDIFGHGPAATAGFVDADRVLPLDTYIDQLDEETRTDFGSTLDAGLVNGQRYLMPLATDGLLFAYRTDFFEEAGLDPTQPPTNWSELLNAAQLLTKREGDTIVRYGLQIGAAGISAQQSFASFLYQAGGHILNEDNTQIVWNSEEGTQALEFMVNLYQGSDAVSADPNTNYAALPSAQQPIATGQSAISLVGPGVLAGIQQANPELMEHIAVMPPIELTQQASYGGAGTGLFINKDSQHPEEAWRFIEFMTSIETSKQYTEVTGAPPARSSFLDSDLITRVPYMKAFLEAQSASLFKPNPNIPTWVQMRDVLVRHLEQAIAGQVTPEEALNNAASEAEKLLPQT